MDSKLFRLYSNDKMKSPEHESYSINDFYQSDNLELEKKVVVLNSSPANLSEEDIINKT